MMAESPGPVLEKFGLFSSDGLSAQPCPYCSRAVSLAQGSYMAINAPCVVVLVVDCGFFWTKHPSQVGIWGRLGKHWRFCSVGSVGDAELLACAGTRVSAGLATAAAGSKLGRSTAKQWFCAFQRGVRDPGSAWSLLGLRVPSSQGCSLSRTLPAHLPSLGWVFRGCEPTQIWGI